MNDAELSDLLESLPRESARPGFTARTVAAARAGRAHRPVRAALAFASMLLVLVTGAVGIQRHRETERLERLRAERQAIARELQSIRSAADERRPAVYLGSSGAYDFVAPLTTSPSNTTGRTVSLHIADDAAF